MMLMNLKINWHYLLTTTFFSVAGIQLFAELFEVSLLSIVTRLLLPIVLGFLYFSVSNKNNLLFYLLLSLLLVSNVFFYFRDTPLFYFGVLAFILLRIVAIIIILSATKQNNYLQIVIASFPFLVIFFYLISVTNEITDVEFNTLILQSILISLLAGISTATYFKNENRQNSWLLISTLLFIGLRFIVFIERFIISDLTLLFNRPISVILNTFAFYTFYKFVITAELDKNITTR
jgi:hypothetical protein